MQIFTPQDFIDQGAFPSKKDEAWKYTQVDKWLKGKNYHSSTKKTDATNSLDDYLKCSLPSCKVETLSLQELKALLKEKFAFTYQDNFYQQFINESLNDIWRIHIPKREEVSLDLRLLTQMQQLSHHAFFFSLEKDARLNLFQSHELSKDSLALGQFYYELKDHAQVYLGKLIQGQSASVCLSYDRAVVGRGARFEMTTLNQSCALLRHQIDISLKEELAHSSVNGVNLIDEKAHGDTYSHIHHHHAHTTSEQLYKSILDGESKAVFTGRVHVHRQAQLIHSEQLNKTLLLSPNAHSHSQPQLEIFADDVKCSHGSTTGQLDPDELFYLQTRGIPGPRAQELVSQGFALDVVNKINSAKIRNKMADLVKQAIDRKKINDKAYEV